jgi:hypothetical protein
LCHDFLSVFKRLSRENKGLTGLLAFGYQLG